MPAVHLATPTIADCEEFLAAVARSRSLHAAWVTPPATKDAFEQYLERTSRNDFAVFLVRRVDDGAAAGPIAGVINISNIIEEPLLSAFLGFYAFEPHAGKGYMKSGLKLALAHAFEQLGLNRLEANIQPANIASIALVRRLGFRCEGFSPKYLRIAGKWRDHVRWALLAEEFAAASEPAAT